MFNTLPTATDAAKTVANGLYVKAQAQAKRIEDSIMKAISDGKSKVDVQGNLETSVFLELKRRGYGVKTINDQRDGDYTTITW